MRGMKTAGACLLTAVVAVGLGYRVGLSAPSAQKGGYIVETDAQLAREEPGTHNGGGMSTGYHFFTKAQGVPMVFTKRALHPGAGIGYHMQREDEIYYFLSGTGVMTLDGKPYEVHGGMGVLTRTGSSHGLKQTGKDDLVLIINYPHATRAPRPAAPAAGK